MTLTTERLTLRPFREDDVEALYAYSKDEAVGLGAGWTLALTDWLVPAMGATGFWVGYGLALWVSFSLYRLRMGRLHRLDAEAVRQRIRR